MTTMELSRKRKKQIKKLRGQTASLLGEQRQVLEHANAILAQARASAADVARKDIAPRVQHTIDSGVRPAIATGIHAASGAASSTKERFTSEIVPGVVSTLGSMLSVVDLAKDPRIQKLVKEASKKASKAQKKGGTAVKAAAKNLPTQKKSGIGFGGVALIVVGVVAVAGAAYAAYQTLRADDDLWVADDSDGADKPAA